MVVCAPTGSGKTVIFELAIIRLLMNSGVGASKAKVVYSKLCIPVEGKRRQGEQGAGGRGQGAEARIREKRGREV